MHNHFDINAGLQGSKIIWIPATNYLYEGIVRIPWISQFILHLFSLIPSLFKYFLTFQKPVSIRKNTQKGNFILWNDSFLHAGIEHKTNSDSIALIF